MNHLKQYVGRQVLVSTADGGAIQGVLWKARRGGLELRKARDPLRNVDVAGIIWVPAHITTQVQVTGGEN